MPTPEPLGARAIRLGYASPEQVTSAIAEQRSRDSSGGPHLPLGMLMIQMGQIAPAQLVRLLDQSATSGFHLSEDGVRLAVRLQGPIGQGMRLLLVTGLRDEDDASTVASQLALVMALMDQGPVLLMDASLRSPTLHEKFHAKRSPGLCEVISGSCSLAGALGATGVPGLSILPAGNADGVLTAQLLSEHSAALFRDVRQQFRLTIVAASPVLLHAQSALLASRTDGVVAVVTAGRARRSEVADVKRLLDGLNARLVGSVLVSGEGR